MTVSPRMPATRQDARAHLQTLRDVLRYAVSRFEAAGLAYGQGTDNARDEAAWLVLWSLHLPPDSLAEWLDCRLTGSEIDAVLDLIERRCSERLPAAWLTGEAWLRGLRFHSDARALVPRSLIAEALEESLGQWLGEGPPPWLDDRAWPAGWPASILDLCTGGGSLAICAALLFPEAEVTGSDLSRDALALAAENRALHGLDGRIRLLQADLFDAVAGERFDLILCNPPYVNAASMAALPPEFQAEPALALAGGADGMDLVRRLLDAAPAHLSDNGLLVVEIGHEAGHFEAAFPDLEFAWLPVTAGECMIVAATRAALDARHATAPPDR
ncbi:MAG: 50S ribosomal protein L3 N(5)-glutamine methyltransferase [Burkholderiaceae bacterium]